MDFSKLKSNLGALFSSLRFWIATLALISSILEAYANGTFTLAYAYNDIQIWLGVVLAIGSFDSVATKFGDAMGKSKTIQ